MGRTYNEYVPIYAPQEEMGGYGPARGLRAGVRGAPGEWAAAGSGVHCGPFYIFGGDGKPIDCISSYRRCVEEHKTASRTEPGEYGAALADLTDGERDDLRGRGLGGDGVFVNPYHMPDDSGSPIDYIEAAGTAAGMRENPELYGTKGGTYYV